MRCPEVAVHRDGPVGYVTFDRRARANAFTRAMLGAIRDALRAHDTDPLVRVVVLRGAGGVFSAGADLAELAASDPESVRRSNRAWIELFATVERLDVPVIASVEGYAIAGGTELTLACDLVVAAQNARFGLTEMRVGVIPGAGACVRLPRWVGRARAKELLFTGDVITAARAHELGMVNRVVPDDTLAAATDELARHVASRSSAALTAAKRAVNTGSELDLDRGIEYVLAEFAALFAGADQEEGMRAFLEKRAPRYAPRRAART